MTRVSSGRSMPSRIRMGYIRNVEGFSPKGSTSRAHSDEKSHVCSSLSLTYNIPDNGVASLFFFLFFNREHRKERDASHVEIRSSGCRECVGNASGGQARRGETEATN